MSASSLKYREQNLNTSEVVSLLFVFFSIWRGEGELAKGFMFSSLLMSHYNVCR